MSEDTLKDLFMELPPRLQDRQSQLQAFMQGELSEDEQAKLHAEAATDEDLAYALTLFAPFDAHEMAGVMAQVQDALPGVQEAPQMSLLQGGVAAAMAPAEHHNVVALQPTARRSRSRLVVAVGGLAAAAALAFVIVSSRGPELDVLAPKLAAYAPQDSLRLEVKVRGSALDSPQVTVLAMAAGEVRRLQTELQGDAGSYFVEAPLGELTGQLAGQVELAMLPGHAPERTDSELLERLGQRARAQVIVQPPAYALAVISEGTLRGASLEQSETASTAAAVPGQLTFRLNPVTRTDGRLALRAFVQREQQPPVELSGQQRNRRGTFELKALSADVLQDAQTATVYLLVGPAGATVAPGDVTQPLPAPWRRSVHVVYRK